MSQYDTLGAFKPRGRSPWRQAGAWSAIALVIVAVVGALVWAFYVQSHGAAIDPQSLCETKGATSVTVMLVDATDRVSPIQREAITSRLDRLLAQLKSNERLDIYEIRPGRDPLSPVFSKCRPLAPNEVNEATGNKRLAQQRFDTEFKRRLASTLDALLAREPAPTSPIMEAIQAADVKSFQSPQLRTDAPGFHRRLIVVSDMLENGDAGSHYGAEPEFATYKKTPQYAQFRSDLTGVEAILLYLRRDSGAQV